MGESSGATANGSARGAQERALRDLMFAAIGAGLAMGAVQGAAPRLAAWSGIPEAVWFALSSAVFLAGVAPGAIGLGRAYGQRPMGRGRQALVWIATIACSLLGFLLVRKLI